MSKYFAVKHKNFNVRSKSRSGGIFTAITDEILKNEGIIYGCIMNKNAEAIHFRADNSKKRDFFRGSKYVQSNMGNIYQQVYQDLNTGKQVLFSGTSCQVSGLLNFIGGKFENLYTIDILCHGVPSPGIWKEYYDMLEKDIGQKINKVDFRNKKKFGWGAHVMSIFSDTKEFDRTDYVDLFYSHKIVRPSCFRCPYKTLNRISDFTIADFWGINKAVKGFNDDEGVSLIICNNNRSEKFFNKINEDVDYVEVDEEKCIQAPLKGNYSIPNDRKKFWEDKNKYGLKYCLKKLPKKYKRNLKWKIRAVLRRFKVYEYKNN